ncbi:MAG: hypothetical protein ABFC54_03640, partial [Thermoguttaceae bacterium]
MIRSVRLVVPVLMALWLLAMVSATSQAAETANPQQQAKKSQKKPAKKPAWPAVKPTLANVPY